MQPTPPPTPPPKVSIILPVYNGLPYLSQAMDSLLSQTFTDFELLAIDDGSNDGSWEAIGRYAQRDPRVRPIKNPANLKLIATLNVGLAHARGEYIARQDADDVSAPDRLARQVEFLEARPDHVIVGSDIAVIDQHGTPTGQRSHKLTSDAGVRTIALLYTPFAAPSVLMRRSAIVQAGLTYDPAMLHAEDYDFYSRLLGAGKGANLPLVLMQYRVTTTNLSVVHLAAQEAMANRIAARNAQASPLTRGLSPQEVALMRNALGEGGEARGEAGRQRELVREFLAAAGRQAGMPRHDLRNLRFYCLRRIETNQPPWFRLANRLEFPWRGLAALAARRRYAKSPGGRQA